jgi:DNA-binding transcriptional regulator YiaG
MTPELITPMLLTPPLAYSISDAMAKKPNVPVLLQKFIDAREKQNGSPFTQEMAAAEIGVAKKTFQNWIQGRRTPRGLSLELLIAKVSAK